MSPALRRKLAILGSTYARALQNAAGRAGRDVSALKPALSQIAQQPLAKLKPGISSFVRERGAIAPSPQQQNMQQMLAHVPWAGSEHGGSPHAEATLNAQLRQRGLEHNTPAGQPNVHQQIAREFGPPRRAPNERPTQVGHASGDPDAPTHAPVKRNVGIGHEGFGGNLFDLWEGAPEGGWAHLPELTRVGVGPQRARALQPPRVNRPEPVIPARTSPIAGHSAPAGDATSVLRKVGVALPKLPGLPHLPAAAGVGIPLALGGAMLAHKPGVQANIKALREGGSTKERDIAGAIPDEALSQADAIHQALLAHGVDPASVRMGIDAPPGSGKTTLAKALSQRAGLKHYGLDWEPGNWWKSTVGLGRNIESMPRAPHAGEVLEHYMLGRTYDPELFDAMVHIRRSPDVLKQQLQHRGHGAYIGDMMDLDKSLGVADLSFDTLGGDNIDLGNGVQMKLRPRDGWGDALDQQLMQKGIDPTKLSRHEKLLSLHAGRRTTGAGWTPYVKNPFSTGETLALGASIPLSVMAAKALARRPR
jgi:hypothetical protein